MVARKRKIRKYSYLGNPRILRADRPLSYTAEEVEEYARCAGDPLYFIDRYVKIVHPDRGLVEFHPYDYQHELVRTFEENRFVVVLSSRQSGKTIIAVGYLLWVALFRPDHNIAILANKGMTARDILARIVLSLENIPFFLQPGCKALNKGRVEFANNSKLFASATSSSSIRGQTCNILYLDEFAFVENAGEFYTATYPVITAGKSSQVIITSTANGVGNPFHQIWQGALDGSNEFAGFRVDWWDVPGRDENWKAQTIANTSELQFAQEFGNDFHLTGNTLISGDVLKTLRAREPLRLLEDGRLGVYEEPQEGHSYVMTVDCAHGRGQDYSVFTVFDVTHDGSPGFRYRMAAVYRSNRVSPLLLPYKLSKYARMYNEAFVVLENNDVGALVGHQLYMEIEYENMYMQSSSKPAEQAVGVRMTAKVKRAGCVAMQELVEKGKLEVPDRAAIGELATFAASAAGTYAAPPGYHDDVAMTMVMFGWFVQSELFADLYEFSPGEGEEGRRVSVPSLSRLFYGDEIDRYIEEELPPVGRLGELGGGPESEGSGW